MSISKADIEAIGGVVHVIENPQDAERYKNNIVFTLNNNRYIVNKDDSINILGDFLEHSQWEEV